MNRTICALLAMAAPAFAQPDPNPSQEPDPEAASEEPQPAAPEPAPEPEYDREYEREPLPEPEPKRRTPFDRGRFGLGLGGGSQGGSIVVAGGAAYYVLDGVELGLGLGIQFLDGPTILRTTPSLRYVVQPLVGKFPLIPYVGTFFSHYFVGDGIADIETVGGRSGLLYVSGSLVLGLGIVYERTISDCIENATTECTRIYPDFTLQLAL